MNKPTKSLVVPTIITCTFAWVWFISYAVESKSGGTNESINAADLIERVKENTITNKVDSFYAEFERLKEEEQKRLEELERQRLERLEKIRLAKIEEAKKIAEQKRIEELKYQQQQEKERVVSRGDTNSTRNWMTFNASYYTAYCSEGCTGVTATGYDVSNTIYYNGLRIIATDPKVIKLGTIVEVITPYETFKAISLDTGGAIRLKKIDVLVSTEQEAIKLGRHNVQLRILKSPI